MNTHHILELARASLSGSLPFPEIIGKLMIEGVEYYFVDYAALEMRFYGAAGITVLAPLAFVVDLPVIAPTLDRAALKAAILDSQLNGQKFSDFSRRATHAGVASYFVFLQGQRVTYLGRQGDQHVEWFPGAKREEA
jgi:uncharacterized protein YbcV (DUF1398 family)